MSVKVMGQVWELDLPHQEVLVLLAMADHADHEGRHVRPSLELLAWKTHYSKRQVIRIIQALETKRLIRVRKEGGGRGRATEYTLHLENGVKKSPFRKSDKESPFDEECVADMPATSINSDKQNSVMASPFENSDSLSPFSESIPAQVALETVTFATQNSDIAMSPQPSLEPSEENQDLKTTPPTPSERGGEREGQPAEKAQTHTTQKKKAKREPLVMPGDIEGQNAIHALIFDTNFDVWLQRRYPHVDAEEQWEFFVNQCLSKDYRYHEFRAAFMNSFRWSNSPAQCPGHTNGQHPAGLTTKNAATSAALQRASARHAAQQEETYAAGRVPTLLTGPRQDGRPV